MTQVTNLDFSGTTIFCGIDVHKRSWRVNIHDSNFELEDFSQSADAVLLHKHLCRKYPGAKLKVGYEAGFSGFGLQRFFSGKVVECLVINAADIPTTDKDKKRKTDRIDARKICQFLKGNHAEGVYIPDLAREHCRTMIRTRNSIVTDQTRCKNRIWQFLNFNGLSVADTFGPNRYWSKNFLRTLYNLDCGSTTLRIAFDCYLKAYEQTRRLLMDCTRSIRKMCRDEAYAENIALLRSIPGIGEVNAAVILFEIQDINRFRHPDNLYSYAGLIPDTGDSGDRKVVKGITGRANHFLRTAVVESSWAVIRKDPALLMKYNHYSHRMEKNKAIIRIGKHLLSRIRYVLRTKKTYEPGVVC